MTSSSHKTFPIPSEDPTAKLPAKLIGENETEYVQRYSEYINPVNDQVKLERIQRKGRPVRVLVTGVFDMFHLGHSRYILQAKNMFPNTVVIAGVNSDETVKYYKGRTMMAEDDRVECVRQCRYVDEVIFPMPWVSDLEFLQKHNIDFVAQNGEPYPMGDVPDIFKEHKDAGMFLPVVRTKGVSTSDYITRVICEYDSFLQRNLARGYSREELGITFLYEKKLEVMMRLEGVQRTINGYIADFMRYYYQPVSERMVEFISPATSPSPSLHGDEVDDVLQDEA